MKRLFTLSFLLFVTITASAQWRVAVHQTNTSISANFMLDENNGWQVGSSGSVFQTSDGARTWSINYQYQDISYSFSAVFFVNENLGFVGGTNATILKTTNGGGNWEVSTIADALGNIKAIQFIDENTGWVLSSSSSSSTVHKTTDGGSTWVLAFTNTTSDLEDMDFYDASHGVACGGGVGVVDLWFTSDGTTWAKAPVPPLGGFNYTRSDARAIRFADASTVYISGWGSSVGLQPSIHLKSTDSGATWTFLTQTEENRTYVNLNAMYMRDAMSGISVGGAAYDGSVIVRTTDGGQNWIPTHAPFGGTCNSVYGIGDRVWVSLNGGTTAYSSDFGNTWEQLTHIPGTSLYTITAKGNSVYAAGYDGLVMRSTDHGVTWSSQYAYNTKSCPSIKEMYFVNENVGYNVRSYRGVSKTTNMGETWFPIMSDTMMTGPSNEGLYFIDENYGFIAGRVANNTDVIYKTTDGGVTYSETGNFFFKDLFGIRFYDANNGVVLGEDLAAGYTTDGGATWNQSTLNNVPAGFSTNDFLAAKFSDGANGVLVGQKMIFTTTNGGAAWDYVDLPWLDKDIKNVAFVNATHGYAVGDKYFLETTDAGKTWTNIADTNVFGGYSLNDVEVDPEGYVWIVSSQSTVFTNYPLVSVIENSPLVESFELSQNYPNPFNPVTNIKFNLNKSAHTSLKVFDMLGEVVAELVNGTMGAGTHSVRFDASSLTSGVYFYHLTSGGESISKKMMLIK
ncbi:MAG: T9SS type A sorting domain-containing protein [Ignavibacteriales bacterium]|nr:T9SS type A sorting domain-containing protein [Ignavibacteriales bacterium]MCF8437406.1 T9SS type A sorting domain-containing protein [Ignavibacteriales bacterium]